MTALFTIETDSRGIATLTLDRPDVHNAFDDELISALDAELQRIEHDSQIRVLILAARGKSFSAGADLNWMRRMASYSRGENFRDAMALAKLMRNLNCIDKPLIAKVQGAAFGGGVGLVACADIAIGCPRASFALTEVRLGLVPAVISPYVINAIGERHARRYFMTAERFTAEEALRVGLLHELVSAETLDERVATIAATIAQNAPTAMMVAKDLVRTMSRQPIDQTLVTKTANIIADRRASAEGREGVAAFLEKREPNWWSE